MNNENVKEWLQLADDDLYSAQILNETIRRPYEIICYHCAQSVEKYLKGYLTFCDIVPKKLMIWFFCIIYVLKKTANFKI